MSCRRNVVMHAVTARAALALLLHLVLALLRLLFLLPSLLLHGLLCLLSCSALVIDRFRRVAGESLCRLGRLV